MAFQALINGVVRYFKSVGTGTTDDPFIPSHVLGTNELATSAWGEPIFVEKHSLGRGLFTFTIPKSQWTKLINGTEVLDTSADTFIFSDNGRMKVTATTGNRYTARTKRHFRYQANRGQQYSDSVWINAPGAGKLYIVIRTISGTTVTDTRTEITGHGLDLSKGNITDGVFQWRGAGNFFGYANLEKISEIAKLGTTTALTITNPALPVFYEAVQGAHALGGVARTGSALRWGLGTVENGMFWEFEYADTSNPAMWIGCWDVSSQGGQAEALTYDSFTTGLISSNDGQRTALAFRVPTTRTNDNGNIWINTTDAVLSQITANAKDESQFQVYYTRDATAITLTAGSWTSSPLTGAVQYITSNDVDVGNTFTFDSAKCSLLLSNTIPIDTPSAFTNPLNGRGEFYLTPGDYIICTHNTSGIDLVSTTVVIGAEI